MLPLLYLSIYQILTGENRSDFPILLLHRLEHFFGTTPAAHVQHLGEQLHSERFVETSSPKKMDV